MTLNYSIADSVYRPVEDSIWEPDAFKTVYDGVRISVKDSVTWSCWTIIYSYFVVIDISNKQLEIIILTREIIDSYDT